MDTIASVMLDVTFLDYIWVLDLGLNSHSLELIEVNSFISLKKGVYIGSNTECRLIS
jgi:hypothetical protein